MTAQDETATPQVTELIEECLPTKEEKIDAAKRADAKAQKRRRENYEGAYSIFRRTAFNIRRVARDC